MLFSKKLERDKFCLVYWSKIIPHSITHQVTTAFGAAESHDDTAVGQRGAIL